MGQEEAGILWRRDKDGRSSYHRFNSDAEATSLGDRWDPIFEAILARGLDPGERENLEQLARKPASLSNRSGLKNLPRGPIASRPSPALPEWCPAAARPTIC
jgi:hypothetical protein